MKTKTQKLTLSALFLAIGLILPFFTGQIQAIGKMLLPMHLPVFLCALICGWKYGGGVGFILPFLRNILFSMPPIYPQACSMALEMMGYGLVSGLIYRYGKGHSIKLVYLAIISGMIVGRIIWGLAMVAFLSLEGKSFTWAAFIAGSLTSSLPGIMLQLILIPAIMGFLNHSILKSKGEHHE